MKTQNRRMTVFFTGFLAVALMGVSGVEAEEAAFDELSGSAGLSGPLQAPPELDRAPVPSSPPVVTNEMTSFWEKLDASSFDSICKNSDLKLTKEARLPNDAAGIALGIKRYLRQYPNKKLALIDEINLKLEGSKGYQVLHTEDGTASLGVSINGRLEGKAMVIRPLDGTSYCRELDTLVKLYEMKTVVPVNRKRLSSMEVGEIWKLPLVLNYGFGGSIGKTIPDVLSISISAGWGKQEAPSVSLYRMDRNNLRLRLRLDRATVRSYGISASTFELPVAKLSVWKSESFLAGKVNDSIAGSINRYISLQLAYGHSDSSGKQLLVEMILDPNNSAQMDGLVEFLTGGNLAIMKRFLDLGAKLHDLSESDDRERGLGKIESAAGQVGGIIGAKSTYAGSNVSRGKSDSFRISFPIIHKQEMSWGKSYNRYQTLGKEGEVLHVHQKSRVSNGESLLGTIKNHSQKNTFAMNKELPDGSVTRPVFAYRQYEGFVRNSDSGARWMIDKANDVLRYMSVNGNGTDESNVLPPDSIFPAPPIDPNADTNAPAPAKFYHSALMSFEVLLNERGVQGIIFAPAQAILNAYLNMMRKTESAIIDKVKGLFMIDAKGEVKYDYHKARQALDSDFPSSPDNGTNPLDIVRTLAYTATRIIADIAGIRDAGGWKAQAERLTDVAAGSGKSGLGYEDFLKVVLQLVEPENVSASLYLQTDKRVKGEKDVNQNYQFLNRDRSFNATISEVDQVRGRFAQPAELTD